MPCNVILRRTAPCRIILWRVALRSTVGFRNFIVFFWAETLAH